MRSAEIVKTPEAALSAADHALGSSHARLTLLQYGDYESPACIQTEPLLQQLLNAHHGRLRLVYRHFPSPLHPLAEVAAEAAEAAAAQGQFWPMHHLLMAQRHHLATAALAGYAAAIGLDMNRFNAEMADRIYTQRVQEHRRAAERSGLQATPAFLLNGQAVDATPGFARVQAAVDAALQVV